MYNTLTIGDNFPSVQLDLNSLIKDLPSFFLEYKGKAENISWTTLTSLLFSCPEMDKIEQALKDIISGLCNSCHVLSFGTVVTVYREDATLETKTQADFYESLKCLKNINSKTVIRVYFDIEGETTHPVEVFCRFTIAPIKPYLTYTSIDREMDDHEVNR